MKIATRNGNGIHARLPRLLEWLAEWLAESRPDVACLQALKAPDAMLPRGAIQGAGDGATWKDKVVPTALLWPELGPHLVDVNVDREQRGKDKASDPAPAWLVLGR